ncbi:MAG: type IIA DNA topoisomerase subunit B [Saprospiraceae bacterium]|jgi:topoisomerase-4 subunit B|uniref:toprim domain-containing protein n=1 Tax=Candidatus Brachybacter algidus TaxID=2982024 RepID=UPI001B435B14|nr:toprim domain-containing protein [Candidatus Brachybacter algidus]MBP7540428.1 type IIA DNA topoisomerase subunit B [Saprospiraceae bacterium]MBK6450777.1 type IIA DNA topoisomerase subunit B [Candidatus Brachybacter algidus]MBK7604886.1 type IIA DNA topoisomerase subunit B [Candidatus Brachybacter algidus]MBK8604541.1 type IIA DNA topoisomerase subunit B [Candidatus Brachybacter algidus]MBK8746980.1 type IIA DNA topoisomerase subunit B [Candidatus Brachybacter algidus]
MENNALQYVEDNIRTLDWREHIRMRPGMYIGKLGDGQSADDGIYILIKEIIDNAMDEYFMGHGKEIAIKITNEKVSVRDYGRGIPLGKVIDCVAQINTGGKYDSKAFKKSVGLNGVGTKAVNALSADFKVQSVRDGQAKKAEFIRGELSKDYPIGKSDEKNGTLIEFIPDGEIFKNFQFRDDIVEPMLWNYAYLNAGLKLNYNGKTFVSKNGLADMIDNRTSQEDLIYPPIHLKAEDIEVVLTHGHHYGEQYYSFVNGQNTTQGGSHLNAFREAVVKTVRDFYKKEYDAKDIRTSIIAAVSVRVEDPIFESQTKTKLGSTHMGPDAASIRSFVMEFMSRELDNFLHRNLEVAGLLQKKILQSERERKEIADIKKEVNKKAKKANVHNKKLRDCRIHFNDKGGNDAQKENSTLFITEGDSASGSITKARDPQVQAVFSLRGKPLNCFGMTKKIVYQNEEFNLLQHALNIEDSIDDLRYNKVVISTDADVDGMHIRLLLLTFFLQFFPDLVRKGHLYILDTPLFRVRDKKTTIYCYSEKEKQAAIEKLRGKPEITRFKGLGEISPDEFGGFIGEDIRLDPVLIKEHTDIDKILEYYMGKNTPDRQIFIIDNLRLEKD